MRPFANETVSKTTKKGVTMSGKGRATEPQSISNSQEPSADMTAAEIVRQFPEVWAYAFGKAESRSDVRDVNAYALRIAQDRIAEKELEQQKKARDQPYHDAVDACDECTHSGMIETVGGWVRHHNDLLPQPVGPHQG